MSTTDNSQISEEQSDKTSPEVTSEEVITEEDGSQEETSKAEEKKPEAEKPKEEDSEAEEPKTPTVPLSDFTRTKDVLFRLAEKVIGNEDALASLAEEDPKLLERLKKEFPKKFKDVDIPTKSLSNEDIEERISREVEKKLKESSKSVRLDELRVRIGLTEIEFADIRDEVAEKADRLLETEVANNYSDALLQAYNLIDPAKAKKLLKKEAVKELHEREKSSTTGSPKAQGESKKFSKTVLDNYKKLGFKSPDEMVKYQAGNIDLTDTIKSKVKI